MPSYAFEYKDRLPLVSLSPRNPQRVYIDNNGLFASSIAAKAVLCC